MTATLHGSYKQLNGQPAEGHLLVEVDTDDQAVRDATGNVVWSGPLRVKLVAGVVSIAVPGTDVVTYSPTGFTYTVTEELDHVATEDRRTVSFAAPDGTTVELADVPSESESSTPDYAAALRAVWEALDDLEAATGVSDHGALTGLSDDDHPQYHNNARGDARYDALGTAAAAVSAHDSDTTNVHGIANTANLETVAGAQAKVDAAVSLLMGGAPSAALDTLLELGQRIEAEATDLDALIATVATKAAAADLTAHTGNTSNPHSVTKAQVGLGNADNTSDLDKPISTATQAALDDLSGSVDGLLDSDITQPHQVGAAAVGGHVAVWNIEDGTNLEDTGLVAADLATKAYADAAYTAEMAQDAVGGILTDSAEIDLAYNDGAPSISASIVAGSIDESKLDASVNASLDLADAAQPLLRPVNVVASAGSTETIPDVSGQINVLTLDSATCTLTFPTPAAGKHFELHLIQDATGGRLVTFPASVKWPQGLTPTLTVTGSRRDTFAFESTDGTNWLGFYTGTNYAA